MQPRSKTVLLSDSNKTYLMYMGLLLKRMGFDVVPATNGGETLRLAEEVRPSMLIMELDLPDMSGKEVLRRMKDDGGLSCIPVALMSTDALTETAEYCRQIGGNAYLRKPVMLGDLHGAIQDCVFAPSGIVRRFIRVDINLKVSVCHDGKGYGLYAETISEGGMFIRKKDPFPVGAMVDIIIPVTREDNIFVTGCVIYTKGIECGAINCMPGMAIEFVGMSGQDARALKEFVSILIAEDIIDTQEEEVVLMGYGKPGGGTGEHAGNAFI